MKPRLHAFLIAACFAAMSVFTTAAHADDDDDDRYFNDRYEYFDRDNGYHDDDEGDDASAQLGPRPYYLVDGMDESRLKKKLQECKDGPFYTTDFSIGHRGAPLQFPEHTKESYEAAARMGAGIIECDVTFTEDGYLVCRHAECDLHTTTNIVATALNNECTVPWTGPGSEPRCCASDLTLQQYKTLTGKMDASDPSATTAEGYLGGTAPWRTDLYTGRGTLLTHAESIKLIRSLGGKFTPELKSGDAMRIAQVFGSQEAYAQKLIEEYEAVGDHPSNT